MTTERVLAYKLTGVDNDACTVTMTGKSTSFHDTDGFAAVLRYDGELVSVDKKHDGLTAALDRLKTDYLFSVLVADALAGRTQFLKWKEWSEEEPQRGFTHITFTQEIPTCTNYAKTAK